MRHHHLENALPPDQWIARLVGAGFVVEEHVPLLGEATARVFLALDEIWHLPGTAVGAELGHEVEEFLARRSSFPVAFRHVLCGLIEMDAADTAACGAVFVAVKPPRGSVP
jgi:hypothetical protein